MCRVKGERLANARALFNSGCRVHVVQVRTVRSGAAEEPNHAAFSLAISSTSPAQHTYDDGKIRRLAMIETGLQSSSFILDDSKRYISFPKDNISSIAEDVSISKFGPFHISSHFSSPGLLPRFSLNPSRLAYLTPNSPH